MKMKMGSQKQMEADLKNADNVADALNVLNEYYDLDNCRPGTMVRAIFINKLVGGMSSLGAKPRKEHQ